MGKPPIRRTLFSLEQQQVLLWQARYTMLGDGSITRSFKSQKDIQYEFRFQQSGDLQIRVLELGQFFEESGIKVAWEHAPAQEHVIKGKVCWCQPSTKMRVRGNYLWREVYNEWYANGKKIVPENIIREMLKVNPEETLARWVADDGSINRTEKRGITGGRIYTDGFQWREVEMLRNMLWDELKIHSRVNPHRDKPILQFSRNNWKLLSNIAASRMHPSTQYKLEIERSKPTTYVSDLEMLKTNHLD